VNYTRGPIVRDFLQIWSELRTFDVSSEDHRDHQLAIAICQNSVHQPNDIRDAPKLFGIALR